MKHRSFVLYSGGLDSTVLLYHAIAELNDHDDGDGVTALSINYGQRHIVELAYARRLATQLDVTSRGLYSIDHHVLQIGDIFGKSMLTDATQSIPNVAYSQLAPGASPTVVPNRNMMLLSIATVMAQRWINAQYQDINRGGDAIKSNTECLIYFGEHADDAFRWAYPDCTPEFMGAMANAIYVASEHKIRLVTPYQFMGKHLIVLEGQRLGVDFKQTFSCYKGGADHCGACPTCRARKEAFVHAGVTDPTTYENA